MDLLGYVDSPRLSRVVENLRGEPEVGDQGGSLLTALNGQISQCRSLSQISLCDGLVFLSGFQRRRRRKGERTEEERFTARLHSIFSESVLGAVNCYLICFYLRKQESHDKYGTFLHQYKCCLVNPSVALLVPNSADSSNKFLAVSVTVSISIVLVGSL